MHILHSRIEYTFLGVLTRSICLFNNQERFFFSFGDHILINDKLVTSLRVKCYLCSSIEKHLTFERLITGKTPTEKIFQ